MHSRVDRSPSLAHIVVGGLLASDALGGAWARRSSAAEPVLFARPNRATAAAHLISNVAGPKDICLVSHHSQTRHDDGQVDFGELSRANHESYARRHGYNYRKFEGRISEHLFKNLARGGLEDKFGGGGHWQKLSALAATADEFTQEGIPLCRWLMWIDADAIFTNQAMTVEAVLSRFAERPEAAGKKSVHAIVAQESSGWASNVINSGVFFVKNNWAGREFLDGTARLYDRYKDAGMHDQDALQHYAYGRDPNTLSIEDHPAMLGQVKPGIAVAPQRAFNSFYWVDQAGEHLINLPPNYSLSVANWHPCDFVGHLPGLKTEVRVRGMDQMLEAEKTC